MLLTSVYICKYLNLSACFSCILKHAKRYGKYVKDIKKMFSRRLFMVQFFAKKKPPVPAESDHLARYSWRETLPMCERPTRCPLFLSSLFQLNYLRHVSNIELFIIRRSVQAAYSILPCIFMRSLAAETIHLISYRVSDRSPDDNFFLCFADRASQYIYLSN